MKFSNDSEKLMTLSMNDFSIFLKKPPARNNAFNKIIKKIHKEILESDKFIKNEWLSNKVKVTLREGHKPNVKHASLLNSSYIPDMIKTYIMRNIKGSILYETTISGKKIKLILYLMNNNQFGELRQFDILVHKMFTWLKFASKYSRSVCAQTMDIHCYLTPIKKTLPRSEYISLSPKHVNTAVTTTCAVNGEICLFRSEELFKVFIHETFHTLGLDFSTSSTTELNRKMMNLFPINSEFNLFEAYTEFWASTMNCLFTAYYLVDDKKNMDEFLLYADYCINYEQFFSLLQCVKTLDFMGLKYTNIFENDDFSVNARRYLYKEKTNVFSYYIVKTILLYNNRDFIMWCKKNNDNIISFTQTPHNLSNFFRFIEKFYKKKGFLKDIKKMEVLLKRIKKSDSILKNTMRMTIIETV